jgi:pimeloyl-ACP methyl ester carboxylesterase
MTHHDERKRVMNKLLAACATLSSGVAVFLAAQGRVFSRVDAGGTRLRMLIAGRGNPTVVFEAGSGGPLEVWTGVQPAVSKFARTVSYDRAGNGLSGKGGMPRDALHVAGELHAALQNAHMPPPYVLVGHSLGGPYIRVFAGLYPNDVAGLVLVDPTQEELIAWAEARHPERTHEHKFRPNDEVDCAPMTFAEAKEYPVPTNIPIGLISGQGPRVVPGFLPPDLKKEVELDRSTLYPAKLKFHKEWLDQFPRGHLIVTENSGHGVPFEEPELVVKAIREVVDRALGP